MVGCLAAGGWQRAGGQRAVVTGSEAVVTPGHRAVVTGSEAVVTPGQRAVVTGS
jgi:hypothetical protein